LLHPGNKTINELLQTMGDGLLITECDGIFAGVNPTSGVFSLIAKGYRVRRGGLAYLVAQILIGGEQPERGSL